MKTNQSRQFRPVKNPSPRRLLNELLPRLQKDLDQGKDPDCGLAQQHGQMTTHHLRFCRSPQAMKQWEIIMKSSMNHTSRYVSSQKTGNILCFFFKCLFILFYRGFSDVNPAEASGLETNVYSLQVSSYVDVYLNRYIYNNLHIQAKRHRHTPRHRQA
jgi:hypothetical protein